MKKSFNYLLLVITTVVALGSVTSCKKGIQTVKGVVTEVSADDIGSVIYDFKVLTDGDTLIFDFNKPELTNGMMVYGDSVEVMYVKHKSDTLNARVIRVIPKPQKAVDLNSMKNNKLLTR